MGLIFYWLAEDTVQERLRKELTEKESWYKDRDEEEESPRKRLKMDTVQPRRSLRLKKIKSNKNKKNRIKSVIFIPHTRNSELANVLRENEEKLADITGNKIKIVEKAGVKHISR